MAHNHSSQPTTTDEVSALATSLNAILKVQDGVSKVSSIHPQQNHRNSKIFDLPYQIPVTTPTTTLSTSSSSSSAAASSSSIICSSQLSLVQFTLTVTQTPVNQQVTEKNKAFSGLSVFDAGSSSHALLHLDESSALASSSTPCMDQMNPCTPANLEVVDLALIWDKFPLETIPVQRFPRDVMFLMKFWADINFSDDGTQTTGLFQVTSIFESSQLMQISCKTSVCSFGRSIGDKVEKLSGIQVSPNRVVYQSVGAPLCDYLVNFIRKLKACGDVATMNGVLENFSVIQVVSNDVTGEVLLCFLHIFEVCPPELSATTGAMCNVYRLAGTTK